MIGRISLLWIAAALCLGAQNPRFQSRTAEVLVPVSVTAKNGKPVESLTAQDFVVTDNGVPENVRLFTSSDAMPLPVDAVIVLEADDEPALAKIKKTHPLSAPTSQTIWEPLRPALQPL